MYFPVKYHMHWRSLNLVKPLHILWFVILSRCYHTCYDRPSHALNIPVSIVNWSDKNVSIKDTTELPELLSNKWSQMCHGTSNADLYLHLLKSLSHIKCIRQFPICDTVGPWCGVMVRLSAHGVMVYMWDCPPMVWCDGVYVRLSTHGVVWRCICETVRP